MPKNQPPPLPSVRVNIELAPEVFYGGYLWRLQAALLEKIPDATCDYSIGVAGAYEVTVNDRLVFSKLERGNFPIQQEVVDYCQMVVREGVEPEVIPQFKIRLCNIL